MQDTARPAESQQGSGHPAEKFPVTLPLLLTPAEAARQVGLARYTIYQLVREGRLQAKQYGRLVLIPREELEHFASSLEQK